jgi:mannose-6-phosphate isomerase-like protein (cupin superfamily)
MPAEMRVFEPGTEADVRNDLCRGGYGTWQPGDTCLVHCHEGAIEFFVFLEGEMEVEVEGEKRTLRDGQGTYIGPGERHKLTAVGDRPVKLFWVVAPNHVPSHTFYRSDGSPVHWDPPGPVPDRQDAVDAL